LLIELYRSAHCPHCATLATQLHSWGQRPENLGHQIVEQDVLQALDAAVALRLTRTPGLVFNGKLKHQGPLIESELLQLLSAGD
jgi:hypothetical protein